MSKIPAKCLHAHYLFEDGVLEFDEPVEIHVSRFGPNMQKIKFILKNLRHLKFMLIPMRHTILQIEKILML